MVRFLSLARVNFCPDSYPSGSWRTDSSGEKFVKTNNGLIYEGHKVAVEEVGRVHIGHLVQLGVADFSEKWALLFTEAPKVCMQYSFIHSLLIMISNTLINSE